MRLFKNLGPLGASAILLTLGACEGGLGGPLPDEDGDGLADEWETENDLDPTVLDGDGDGWTDGEEVYGFADPNDEDDHPYTGGWPRGPIPEDLEAGPAEVGEIAESFALLDQYGDRVDLWTFYGQVILIENAAEW